MQGANSAERHFLLYLRVAWLSCVASVSVVLVFPLCAPLVRSDLGWDPRVLAVLALGAVGLFAVSALSWRGLRRAETGLATLSEQHGRWLDTLPDRWIDLAIIAAAGTSLFLELAVIRWQTSLMAVFALCKNFSLLACFAGLGLGYAMAGSGRILLVATVPLLGWQILVMMAIRFGLPGWYTGRFIGSAPATEEVGLGLHPVQQLVALLPTYLLLGTTFLLTAVAFLPVGQLCGRVMALRPKLRGYGLNLVGSLLGVLVSFGVSWLWTPPAIWFLIGLFAVALFQGFRWGAFLGAMVALLVAVAILVWPVAPLHPRVYSPYQVLERTTSTQGLLCLRTVEGSDQNVIDLSAEKTRNDRSVATCETAAFYEMPYLIHGHTERAAVVGSGLGNDVAAALRMGCEHVDAIEIDPAILLFGREAHPEKPYSDARVKTIINDARSFLRTTSQFYDLIVYGLLSSKVLLSQASSSVRIDSFVYTVEGLREARSRLKEGGTLCMAFYKHPPEMGRKICLMLQEVFDGRVPMCIESPSESFLIFVEQEGGQAAIVPSILRKSGFRDVTARYADARLKADVPTDDWPFFYMPRRAYPVSFLPVAGLALAITLLLTRLLPQQGRPSPRHMTFFLLGAGFMLVEVKAITELGLTFGNTWQVIGITIIGILLMAFLANAAVARFRFTRISLPYVLLLASLALGYAVVRRGGFPPTPWGRIGAALLLTCPVFFSGIIFSSLLRLGGSIAGIMAANLLGAMLGGFLEYNAMCFGFRSLYLIAIGMYGLAFVSGFWRTGTPGASPVARA